MSSRVVRRRTDLAEFLRAVRARLQPSQVGLPEGGRRRTPGLRRQEVAQLAAVSVEWYVRLEQGRVGTPGAAVLDALARALRLSPSERRHLHLIGRGEAPAGPQVCAPIHDSLRVLLDGMPLLPGYVMDFRLDVLAHNAAAAALFGADFGTGGADNIARLLFLSPRMRESQLDWERVARETVGNLRANLAAHRDDARLLALIAELRDGSPEFATWWHDHTVQERAHGTKRVRHPVAGELALCYDVLATLEGSGQRLVAVTPVDPASDRALRTLMADHAASLAGPGVHPIVAA
ncbi:helix-turn-helix transcriptional regulator [Streptomyces sp. FH025]|uniref:helix-turn-helix transcriptional regulator n=1 Tax=Streptomyces sp. FH025 TaxID=2815937 RepID=UPI001A9CFFFA|nr:helix-turn-helix transcriptional regulator [Streptomyces sp. FH025]MBO1414245.1 helix-turn-helix domain-containing protein [Streptomyces sp. FH025]